MASFVFIPKILARQVVNISIVALKSMQKTRADDIYLGVYSNNKQVFKMNQ